MQKERSPSKTERVREEAERRGERRREEVRGSWKRSLKKKEAGE